MHGDLESVLQLARDYAPVRIGLSPPAELTEQFRLAEGAASKFASRGWASLSPAEVQALHTYVYLVTRPSLPVRSGELGRVPTTWEVLQDQRALVNGFLPSVGRLDSVVQGHRNGTGTGWFVGENLLMTNAHVVAALCQVQVHGNRQWPDQLKDVLPDFNAQWASLADSRPAWDPADAPTEHIEHAAGRVVHADVHATLDMAVLSIEGVQDSASLVLSLSAEGPVHGQKQIYTLGYPAIPHPGVLHPALLQFLFGTSQPGMTKRVAPGKLIDSATGADHDATTLGGSSGSPILDIESHLVVGLHYAGQYGERNHAVPLWMIQTDPFFEEHGLRFV